MKAQILFLILLLVPLAGADSTILTAKRAEGAIELDGRAVEEDWKQADKMVMRVQDGSIGKLDVSLKALYDQEYLYVYASWSDPTESVEKDVWLYTEKGWEVSGDEDRIAFHWNIDDSISGFNIAGCAMLCHGDRMHTNEPWETGDLWHWKASRTNPLGYADDEWMDNTVLGGYSEESKEAARRADGTYSVFKEDESYLSNANANGTGPKYYEPKPVDDLDKRFIFQDEVDKGDAIEIKELTQFSVGDWVPGYVLWRPKGNRGDLDAKGVWEDGRWVVEFRRKLNTGFSTDARFDVSKIYRFGIAVMDNTGGFEAYGKGHSFGLGARTLEFGGSGSSSITQLSLINDYLVTAKAHAEEDEVEKAVSNINDALILYGAMGDEIAKVDPELYLSTKKQFVQVKRTPSVEGIVALQNNIDQTILTFQGKRLPPEATWRVKLLVVWGKFQIYALVLLAIISLAPIFRAIKVGRKPTFRRLSVFILIVIIPLFFEGIGRIGILLKINALQSFSFLTNEFATLQWALLMFFGLFIAKSGFEEVEESMKSMEYYSATLEDDIAKMKSLETELKNSEKRYRGLFDASPVGILEIDNEGKIIICNHVVEKFINCKDGMCRGMSFMDLIIEPKEKDEIASVLEKGGALKDRLVSLKDMSGKEVFASISLEPIKDEEGQIARTEIAVMDVTDRIRAQEEKVRLEKELAQSEKLASIGKLAMGVAHEISNPLTNIQLAVERLLMGEKEDIKSKIDVITHNVEMASSVVRNLLDFSRKAHLKSMPIDIEKVLDGALEMASPRLKDINVVKKMKELPKIPGDERQLQQVFANIIINAAQAMPQGGKLKIASKVEGSYVVLSFSDTGVGIPEEYVAKVFDPFFTTKEVGMGTGLGLSLSYGIVKAHGGEISIESAVGKGTTVTVRLPLEKRPDEKVHEQWEQSKAQESEAEQSVEK